MQLQEGDWQAELLTRLEPGRARVQRRVRRTHTARRRHCCAVCCSACPMHNSENPPIVSWKRRVIRPDRGSRSPPRHGTWGALSPGTFCDAPAWRPPLVGLHHPTTPRSLGGWAWTQTEPFFPRRNAPPGVSSATIYLADRFAPATRWSGERSTWRSIPPTGWRRSKNSELLRGGGVHRPRTCPSGRARSRCTRSTWAP